MTEADFRSAIAAAPSDWPVRAAFADWLAEQGRDDEAHGQRWIAKRGKRPFHREKVGGRKCPARYSWAWWKGRPSWVAVITGATPEERNHRPLYAVLNREIFLFLPKTPAYVDHRYYPSESAAEAALCAALKALLEAVRA